MIENGFDDKKLLHTSDPNILLIFDENKKEIEGAMECGKYVLKSEFSSYITELAKTKLHAISLGEKWEKGNFRNG